ncbi:PLDc N-terminal domain-containing protein [Niabella ginsengisoli]|uniref:PLDc N-terminal domain-containing protein n=1 Tax=Niabella ginsengisoli TaxID=522298 RepID=UPI00374D6B7F
MDNSGLSALIILGIISFIWILPILSIACSRRTTGSEKLAWILAVIFVSWFAWIFYLLLAPIKKK